MNCPKCDCPTAILQSRYTHHNMKRRRRECPQCKNRFSTLEMLEDKVDQYELTERKLSSVIGMLEAHTNSIITTVASLRKEIEQ